MAGRFRHNWKALAVLIIVSVGVGAQQPPADLRLVGDHWTAWDPPSSFPEGAQVHVVQPGDTLWDLAERFYGDPYLWPQIWERNGYVRDAHWIYPGDPLLVGMQATPVSELESSAVGEDLTAPAADYREQGGLSLGRFSGAPVTLGSEVDIYCSGFIGDENEEFPLSVIGSEYENLAPDLTPAAGANITGIYGSVDTVKYDLTTGDIVYVDGGQRAGLYPGMMYTAVSKGERAIHPVSGKDLGRFYDYHGRLRILSVQAETAIAEITYSCDPINVGDRLELFQAEPVPLGRRTPIRGFNDPLPGSQLQDAPAILRSRRDLVSLGIDHVVFIDRELDRDQAPGDIYTIYRLNAPGMPSIVVGELAVLTVRGRSAVGRILESRYTVHVGDRLSLKSQ